MKRHDANEVKADFESLKNTKITSNKIKAKKTKAEKRKTGRILTQMECLTVLLGADLVMSTVEFIHMPTSPREYRSAFFKEQDWNYFERVDDFLEENVVRGQHLRQLRQIPIYRRFSEYQLDVILDEKDSPLSMDAITIFSIRPPELRFVNSVRLYLRWFKRIPAFTTKPKTFEDYQLQLQGRLTRDFATCEWIDGMDTKVVLRRGAIDEIVDYLQDRNQCSRALFGGNSRYMATVRNFFEQIQQLYRRFELNMETSRRRTASDTQMRQYMMVCQKFLLPDKTPKLPTVWSTPVYPKNKGRFLVSILLLFGRFETEYELMLQGDMKKAYIHAGLFDPSKPQDSFDELLQRYCVECLFFVPGSMYQRDRNLVYAESALAELLLEDEEQSIPINTPCILQSHMVEETEQKVKQYRENQISCFVDSLCDDLANAGFVDGEMPSREDLKALNFSLPVDNHHNASPREIPYIFPPQYNPEGAQSESSYQEQLTVLLKAKNTIARYKGARHHKNMVVCGGPGNGKTTVCMEICLYAFSQGLNGMVSSVVADRSKTLGGVHIHQLFAIPVSERLHTSPGRAAESAIVNMYRKPELLYLWQRLDFLFIDELGAVSGELLATMDIIARHVKESSSFFGGMILICSMDPRQLLPVTGMPVMLSMNMMTEFAFSELKESVRAANDESLRRLCELSRTIEWTDDKKSEFKTIIKEKCNFVSSLNDSRIPEDAVFVFGRKAPCKTVEESIIQRIRNSGARVLCSESFDEESSFAGNWKEATSPSSKQLSQKVKEKKQLYLFEKGRYEFTYNLHGRFQQGQLALLLELDNEAIRQKNELKFYRAPAGCKEFPPLALCTHEYLMNHGWEIVMVPYERGATKKIFHSLLGRRTQYGVRLRVASTIHASQGSTFGKLVTAVTNTPSMPDLNFTLWEAAQVIVLTSRTRHCNGMYFIGNPDEIVDQLCSVLGQTSRYLRHIQALSQRLCGNQESSMIIPPPPIFRPCDIVLQQVPAVYLLVSTRHIGYMYIGQTHNIRKRLNQHNSGQGSKFTNNARLRPWALFGYVTGFRQQSERLIFEKYWKCKASEETNRARRRTATGVLQIATDLVCIKNVSRSLEKKLLVHQCGEMVQKDRNFLLVDST